MQKEVMIRRPLRHGGTQMVKATVLSQHGDTLRVVRQNENKPIEVKASDIVDAGKVFAGNRLAQQHGVIVAKQFPDNPSSLHRMLK